MDRPTVGIWHIQPLDCVCINWPAPNLIKLRLKIAVANSVRGLLEMREKGVGKLRVVKWLLTSYGMIDVSYWTLLRLIVQLTAQGNKMWGRVGAVRIIAR